MVAKTVLIATAAVAILCGWFQLVRFSTTPGEQAAAPARLPADLLPALFPAGLPGVPSSHSRPPLLLVFVHPRCSCTPATYAQLDRLLDRVHTPVDLVLAIYKSSAVGTTYPFDPRTLLHHPFRQVADTNGLLARRFGAATSGEVLLYDPSRRLLFQGGVTPGRAHAGDSPGAQALRAALLSGQPGAPTSTAQNAVFGCPIFRLARSG